MLSEPFCRGVVVAQRFRYWQRREQFLNASGIEREGSSEEMSPGASINIVVLLGSSNSSSIP